MRLWPLLLLLLPISGCTYGDRASFETTSRLGTSPATIEVVESRDVRRPYKVIGIVSAESYYLSAALKRCRAEAAKLGADALLDFGPTGNRTGVASYGYGLAAGSTYNTGWSAKALVWE